MEGREVGMLILESRRGNHGKKINSSHTDAGTIDEYNGNVKSY